MTCRSLPKWLRWCYGVMDGHFTLMSALISKSASVGRRLINSLSSTHPSTSNPSRKQSSAMAVKDLVESAIDNNTVVIFSKSWCPYCKRAKALFAESYPSATPKVFELDQDSDGEEIQSYLGQKTGQRTVPNIFINQKHVGGSDDLQALHKRGGIKL